MFRDVNFEKLGDRVLRMILVEREQSKLLEHELNCSVDFKMNGKDVEIVHLHNYFRNTIEYKEIKSYFYLKYPSYVIEIDLSSKKYVEEGYVYTGELPLLIARSFIFVDKLVVDSRIHSDVKKLILEHYNKTSQNKNVEEVALEK